MKTLLVVCLSCLLILSCSAERRATRKFNRLIEKYPALVRTDTVWTTDLDTIPAINVDVVIPLNHSINAYWYDSLQTQLINYMPPETAQQFVRDIRTRPILIDTFRTWTEDSILVKVFQNQAGDLQVQVFKKQQVQTETHVQSITSVTPANLPRSSKWLWFLLMIAIGCVLFAWSLKGLFGLIQ